MRDGRKAASGKRLGDEVINLRQDFVLETGRSQQVWFGVYKSPCPSDAVEGGTRHNDWFFANVPRPDKCGKCRRFRVK
jgi:hypothetical protein